MSSTVKLELLGIRRGLRDRAARLRRVFVRGTLWPLAVRLAVFAAALTGLALATPRAALFSGFAVVLAVLAALPALWPRTAAVSVYWLCAAFGWLVATTLYGEVATLPRLIGLTVALYVVHSGAALAAVLPYDAVVAPAVLARWALRAIGVLAVALAASLAALLWAGGLAPRTYLAATLVGLVATVALAAVLARALRRP